MYVYAEAAYDTGKIREMECKALKNLCINKVDQLRKTNKLEIEKDTCAIDVVCAIGGFIPYAGVIFDVLGDVTTVYAATLDSSAMVKISDETNFASITHAIARNNAKYGFKYTVYELYDKTTGAVKYVGRTRQPLTMRKMQHWATDSAKKGLQIQVARIEGKELKGLLYSEARGLEQLAYENYTKNGIKLLNKIRPLSNSTKKAATKAAKYLDDAGKFLKKII